MNADFFAACVKSASGIASVARALASDMPGDPVAELMPSIAEALLNPDRAFPDVPASGPLAVEYVRNLQTLRDLVDWDRYRLRARSVRQQITSPVEHDGLCNQQPLVDWTPLVQFTHAALSLIRPTRQAAVIVTMRDDGISILEWIAHYRAIGFEGVFVYSNDNIDGSDPLLRKLADQGIITFIENNTSGSVSPQRKAFEHSLHFLPELRDYEWVFYADSDEFLVPGEEYDCRVAPVLAAVSAKYLFHRPTAICYHWRWFVSNYAFARTEGLLLERFEHAIPYRLFKSMVQIADVLSMRRLHFPDVSDDKFFVDSNLDIMVGSIDHDSDAILGHHGNGYRGGQLNHYWCKSFEEFAIKKWRGDQLTMAQNNAYKRETELFFTWNDYERSGNAVPVPTRLLTRVRAELEKLRSLDGVEELQTSVRLGFYNVLASITRTGNFREAYADLAIRTSISHHTRQALVDDHRGLRYNKVLKELHAALRPDTYFEIGSLTGDTLVLAQCESIAVDPAFRIEQNVLNDKKACHLYQLTSDDFFAAHRPLDILGRAIDFAFLDGLHLFEFLLRDFMNTEAHCRRDSMIALHDCLPTDVHIARREPQDATYKDRLPHHNWWAGDVWKTLLILKKYRPDLKITCVDAGPTGLVLITALDPKSTLLRDEYGRIVREYTDLDLMEYSIARLFNEMGVQSTDVLWATQPGPKRLASTVLA